MSNATSELLIVSHKIKYVQSVAGTASNRLCQIGRLLGDFVTQTTLDDKNTAALENIREQIEDMERLLASVSH